MRRGMPHTHVVAAVVTLVAALCLVHGSHAVTTSPIADAMEDTPLCDASGPSARATAANSHFVVSVLASPCNVSLDVLQVWQDGDDGVTGAYTINLVVGSDTTDPGSLSGSSLLLSDGDSIEGGGPTWYLPTPTSATDPGASLSASNDTAADTAVVRVTNVVLMNPTGNAVANESWAIELDGDTLRWSVSRIVSASGSIAVVGDASPHLVFRTVHTVGHNSETPIDGAQIPSVLDTSFALNGSVAFSLFAPSDEVQWREIVSPAAAHGILLVPSGLGLASTIASSASTPPMLSFGHPPSDGTRNCWVGVEGVDRRTLQPAVLPAGHASNVTWSLSLLQRAEAPVAATFDLTLPPGNEALQRNVTRFATVSNSWYGWIFGNNPASTPCLHEMGLFPIIHSLFRHSDVVSAAFAKQLRLFASADFVLPSGYVYPRWTTSGPYNVTWGPLHDQVPHFVLAVYFYAVNTGDLALVKELMPAVDRVAGYMLSLGLASSGVAAVPGASGLADGGRHTSNWYDIIEFGHQDAYVNAYCLWALQALVELKTAVGDAAGAAKYEALGARVATAFNATFWDADKGFYRDWIDVEGVPRTYMYADQQFLAILLGAASQAQADSIFAVVDGQYAHWAAHFGVSREADMWATPSNFFNVSAAGDMVNNGTLGDQKEYPNYENGNAFLHVTGLEIAARAAAKQYDAAWAAVQRVFVRGYTATGLWGAGWKWAPSNTTSMMSEPLTDNALIVWGFLRAGFGVTPTLTRGLVQTGLALPQMVGASWTFGYLGVDHTLTVNATRGVEIRVADAGAA